MLKRNIRYILICLSVLILFFPSLFSFYTNDDFFLLKIARINTIGEFFNFFNILKGPDGFGMYRPITTQLYYFLGWKLFYLNPFGLHVIAFATLFAILLLFKKLLIKLGTNKETSYLAMFFYAVSASHFGHMYYLATFQELGMTFFVLMSCLYFIDNRKKLSILYFILGLMSKETAIITPLLLGLIFIYKNIPIWKRELIIKVVKELLPYAILVTVYMILRVFSYGFATGDSYVWDFTPQKIINTISWYSLWAINIPESVIDFVGPGIKLNPNLFKYWSAYMIPIFLLTALFVIEMLMVFSKSIYNNRRKPHQLKLYKMIAFGYLWFLLSLIPVMFLPIHKFTFYLTLPLLGIVYVIAQLIKISRAGKVFKLIIVCTWTLISIFSVKYSMVTSWITRSQIVSRNVYNYFINEKHLGLNAIVFIDTENDQYLPWSPTGVLKVALSDQNFFAVFFPDLKGKVYYIGDSETELIGTRLKSRMFLGY